MNHPPPNQAFGPTINRLGDAIAHLPRYSFKGVTRIAEDAKVSAASVSRVLHDSQNPSFLMVCRLTDAIERQLGCHVDPRDLFAESGHFLTHSVCDLVHCRGCLPGTAHDEFGELMPRFHGIKPGTWVTSRYPSGYQLLTTRGGRHA